MSQESFIKDNLPWVDFLKLRASYGGSGKDNLSAFLYEYLYSARKDGYIFPSGTSIPLVWTDSYILSRNLKWSTTKTYNIGLDVDVLRRKLGLELDVFYQVTSDLLEGIGGTFPSSLGGNTPKYENSGAVDNRGIDFTVKHELTVNKDFSYRLRGIFGFARNKVLRKKINDDHPSWRNTLGYPMGARFGLIATGLAQTQEQIDNAPAPPSDRGAGFKETLELPALDQVLHAVLEDKPSIQVLVDDLPKLPLADAEILRCFLDVHGVLVLDRDQRVLVAVHEKFTLPF